MKQNIFGEYNPRSREENLNKKSQATKTKIKQNCFTNLMIYPISSLGTSGFHIILTQNSTYSKLIAKTSGFSIRRKILKLEFLKFKFPPMKFKHFAIGHVQTSI